MDSMLTRATPGAPTDDDASEAASDKMPRYLLLRNGVYYYKRRVPAQVAKRLKLTRQQVWKSLGTSDLQVARHRLATAQREFDDLVRLAQSGRAPPARPDPEQASTSKYLLPEHIPALLERYEYFVLATDDEERRAYSAEQRAERLQLLEEGLQELYERAAADDFESMDDVAEDLLARERLIGPPRSRVRLELCQQLMRKDIELMELQRNRLLGKVHLTPKQVPPAPRELPTLMSVFAHWRKTKTVQRTIDTYHACVGEFEKLVGALPVATLTPRHAERFRDELAERGLLRVTVKNRLDALSTLFRFGLQRRLYGAMPNPFEDIVLDDVPVRPVHQERRAYESAELAKLFASALYTSGFRPGGQAAESAYWAPLLALFTGMRLEEVAQLKLSDVHRIGGAWALRIANLDEYQSLKTPTSYRTVPVHEELLKCGLLEYVESVRVAGHGRLFPSHRNDNKYKRWGNALGKWFSRYIDQIGLSDKRLSFHSFRFTFKQQCTLSGIEDEVRDALAGHWVSRSTPGRGYMRAPERQYPFPALVAAMQKLRYDLDLSHLYTRR
ncbi:MAG: site-specific integrase [Rubrivivax sp.]|nr:site-specific integrase [Rubrivivax sp.]